MRFSGKVEKGRGYGRTIGFPTANIPFTDATISGIYAAQVELDGISYPAAVYVDPTRNLLEAHILDWTGDCYEKEIIITLVEKVREAATFSDDISLMKAIAADVAKVRESLHH